jgi:hypothetical protein
LDRDVDVGSGNGDFVEVGPSIINITTNVNSGGDASSTITLAAQFGETITNDNITFGNGNGDFVKLAHELDVTPDQSAASVNGAATNTLTGTINGTDIAISNDHISFGNGNGDFVDLEPLLLPIDVTQAISTGSPAHNNAVLKIEDLSLGEMNCNTIKFGNGAGDFVSAAANFTNNNIVFGNGDVDHLSVTDGTTSNNQIILGNGNNDSVSLTSGAGGNTIITGTGNSDTVTVGGLMNQHTNDTFGFALGTGSTALSQTTVFNARAGDEIAVGNSSGLVLTNSGLGDTHLVKDGNITTVTIATVHDYINYITSHEGLTKGDTYTADSGGNTFVVTDTLHGQVGGIELVGVVFEASTLANHILTLA